MESDPEEVGKTIAEVLGAEIEARDAEIAKLKAENKRLDGQAKSWGSAFADSCKDFKALGELLGVEWSEMTEPPEVFEAAEKAKARIAELEAVHLEADQVRRERNRTAASVLGGTVEGAPTNETNWIQRARMLVSIEGRIAELEYECAQHIEARKGAAEFLEGKSSEGGPDYAAFGMWAASLGSAVIPKHIAENMERDRAAALAQRDTPSAGGAQ